ncbi:MAG: ATP-binding protein [Pseudonocardiales bacterium]
MNFQELRGVALFDGLSDSQLSELMAAGEEFVAADGTELFRDGTPADHWWVLLDGAITLLRRVGGEDTELGTMTSPGQWAGGFGAWDSHGVYFASGRALGAARGLRVSAENLRQCADAWFPFGVHFIKGLMNTVRRIETAARQREALVALGTLAAGLAHEINNPASAATRAVDAIENTSNALLDSLTRLAGGAISAQQFVELDSLRRQIDPHPAVLDSLAVADREEVLSDWLVDHGIERDWVIAPALAAAGIDIAWCERVAELLGPAPVDAGLEWVASSLSMAALLSEVKESTRRISDLVAAVRSYSQLDRASVQSIDVIEGLESTLVMLSSKLHNITVVREYATDLPRIEAMAGELNQVWTNLIDNAIDAMDGAGTLRIAAGLDDVGHVVVEIADTGPGMPREVQAHAFEPFYTTKDVGKGTGLGLDISRRIVVEHHSGEIEIESEPGSTVLRVRIPPWRSSHP